MPILAMDKYGRLYETGRDRADGRGFSSHARPVSTSDTTLGAVYLNQQEETQRQALKEQMLNDQQARQAKLKRAQQVEAAKKAKFKEQTEEILRQNRSVQNNLIRRGLSTPLHGADFGCPCSDQNQTQQSISHVMSGMGRDVTLRAPRTELLQQAHQNRAEKILRNQANQQARLEAAHRAHGARVSAMKRALNKR